jgi:dimethylargininase
MPVSSAIVRGVPDSFEQCIRLDGASEPISVSRARDQHAAYVAALESLGLRVRSLPADPKHPDCCFVEDPAIVVDELVVAAEMAAASRRGEAGPVIAALEPGHALARLEPPATLDGGDVVRIASSLFVGLSTRTNDAAVEQMIELFEPRGFSVRPVPVEGVLHLKSACTHLGDGSLLTAPSGADLSTFDDIELVPVPAEEAYAANVVAANGAVLVAAGFPRTAELIAARGLRVVPVDTSEFRKGGGSLTCLSVLL